MQYEAVSEDDRDDLGSAFSSRGVETPSPHPFGTVARLVHEPRNDTLLLGPSGAGKTALLSSLSEACAAVGTSDLAVLPHEDLAALKGEAEAYRHGTGDWPPTRNTTSYAFQLRAGAKDFFLKAQDGPGWLLFPFSPARWDALSETEKNAYEAASLILCIDATNPRSDLWRTSLPQILARIAIPSGRLLPRLVAPPPAWSADFPRLRTPGRQLPYQRVLVVFTQIDRLVQAALRTYAAGSRQARGRMPPLPTPTELALQIDALRLLDDAVGPLLGQLRTALEPSATLAVGLTSAWGMDGLGGRWRPFGVREALLFLATGECHEPVVRYDNGTSSGDDTSGWFEIPSTSPRS
jgi:hypothetical protein